MILQTSVFLLSIIALINGVAGASFSKVFVQNAPEVVPVEYIQYGSPSVPIAGPQIAQISAAPMGSVVPVPPNLPPCGTPCVYPGQAIAPFAPIAPPSANYITYNSPISNVPVVVTRNKDLPSGYEYSYVVYDESTGDHKQQRELSDGSVVRGEYSFIQPDGIIREVHYVADDLKGFNAIVKNFLPVNVEETKNVKHTESKDPSPPCHEVKNEPLKVAPESHEIHIEIVDEHQHEEESKSESHGDSTSKKEEKSQEHKEQPQEEHSLIEPHEILEVSDQSHSLESSPEPLILESSQEPNNLVPSPEQHTEAASHVEQEPLHEDPKEKPSNENPEEILIETDKEGSHDVGLQEAPVEHVDATVANADVLIPYSDIIRCVQAAINGANESSTAQNTGSPLTYLVLNKPC